VRHLLDDDPVGSEHHADHGEFELLATEPTDDEIAATRVTVLVEFAGLHLGRP
jgi:hypothetical protein